jgi:CheY-like chemotaxis protein
MQLLVVERALDASCSCNILDAMLPGCDGFHVVTELRDRGIGRELFTEPVSATVSIGQRHFPGMGADFPKADCQLIL